MQMHMNQKVKSRETTQWAQTCQQFPILFQVLYRWVCKLENDFIDRRMMKKYWMTDPRAWRGLMFRIKSFVKAGRWWQSRGMTIAAMRNKVEPIKVRLIRPPKVVKHPSSWLMTMKRQKVTPVSVVNALPEKLDGRLSAIHLLGRHVEIVHKDDGLLAHLGAKHTLSALVQLGHDDVLQQQQHRVPVPDIGVLHGTAVSSIICWITFGWFFFIWITANKKFAYSISGSVQTRCLDGIWQYHLFH